jgi:hypothetical protein
MIKLLVLLLAYAIAPAVAGHGVAPMALMLLPVRPPELGQVVGWVAIGVLAYAVTGSRKGTRAQPAWSLVGAIVLYLSWLTLVLAIAPRNGPDEADTALDSMLQLSLPFQVAFVVVVVMLVRELWRARSASQPATAPEVAREDGGSGPSEQRASSVSRAHVPTLCASCSAPLDTPYILLGASTRCGACGQVVVPKLVGVPGTHGVEISFGSFVQLLTHEAYRERALPRVASWFPEVDTVVQAGERPAPGSAAEAELLRIHRAIQGDRSRQGALYNLAMGLWR